MYHIKNISHIIENERKLNLIIDPNSPYQNLEFKSKLLKTLKNDRDAII
jgi:hypothetical protein